IPVTLGDVIGTVVLGIAVVKPGTIGVVALCGEEPAKTNVPFEFNCVATGSDVKDGPTNANPRTPTGTSEVMNRMPVKGCEKSASPGKNSVTNLGICVRPAMLSVLVVTVIPLLLLRPSETFAVASFGLRIAIPVSIPEFTSTLTTTLVRVTSGLGN